MAEKAAGIIAEYNPFHNGHRWQLQALREVLGNIPVIVCMSGFTVQRGELAFTDPWARAEIAVQNGVDLVLALPAVYSLRSADYFAAGGVDLLAATGLVDTLVCGQDAQGIESPTTASPCADPQGDSPDVMSMQENTVSVTQRIALEDAARWTLSDAEKAARSFLRQGYSYAAAWEQAARQAETKENCPGLSGWFTGSNNILALAYQKRILQKKYPLVVLPLPRQGSPYKEMVLEPPYASASAIRSALADVHPVYGKDDAKIPEPYRLNTDSALCPPYNGANTMPGYGGYAPSTDTTRKWEAISRTVPPHTLSLLKKTNWSSRFYQREKRLAELLSFWLLNHDSSHLYAHSSAGKDFCRRFFREREALSQGYAAFVSQVAHKRDSRPMVQRLALQLLLNRSRQFWLSPAEPAFLRVLAFNDRGRSLLKEMKQTASLPLIIKLGRKQRDPGTPLYDQLRTDLAASDLFNLTDGRIGCYGEDFQRSPIYINA